MENLVAHFFWQWQLGGKGMKDGSGFAPGLIVPQTITNARKNPRMDDPEGTTKLLDQVLETEAEILWSSGKGFSPKVGD